MNFFKIVVLFLKYLIRSSWYFWRFMCNVIWCHGNSSDSLKMLLHPCWIIKKIILFCWIHDMQLFDIFEESEQYRLVPCKYVATFFLELFNKHLLIFLKSLSKCIYYIWRKLFFSLLFGSYSILIYVAPFWFLRVWTF